jgi:nitroreductase
VAIVTTDEALGPYGAVDCGLYVGTFLLAAQAFGVAAVPQGALAEHSGFIRSYLGLSDRRLVVCGISFGFEDPDHPANRFRTERAAIHEVATFLDE